MRKRSKELDKMVDKKKSTVPSSQREDLARARDQADQWLDLQRAVGNRAVETIIRSGTESSSEGAESQAKTASEKSVDFKDEGRIGQIVEKGPSGGSGSGSGSGSAPKKAKKAGVDSFKVTWSENASTTATNARLRLDYKAKFKDDDEHDPALAEFRQNVMTKWEIKDGPNKGQKGDTSPMHDDNYSRADDILGRPKTDVNFESNDNPGLPSIDKDDDLDYAFTAEDMIIDTSQGNKVLEKVGPKTGTIKGKHPRKFSIPSNC